MKTTNPPKTAKKAVKGKTRTSTTRSKPLKTKAEGKDKPRKEPFGRPTDFKPEYVEQVKKFCLLGADDKDLARMFEVDERTINRWKDDHPDFCQSMREGKEIADAEIAQALYHRAKGYSHPEVHISNYQGMITETPLVKHYPPDTAAASLWMRNRQSGKWRDKIDHEHAGKGGGPIIIQATQADERL